MYQAEALWINLSGEYPCAVKVAAGKINAVTGRDWSQPLNGSPQDYVVSSVQPGLDGFNVSEGLIRQFVAMPLGDGYSAEEQLTGKTEHGGIQFIVYPMKREIYDDLFKNQHDEMLVEHIESVYESVKYCAVFEHVKKMSLAPGGLMRQEIYDDDYGLDVWD